MLTSAEFGDAYLRNGWASRYIHDLVRAYTVVLVGYQAEDPPMRYLLEALEADRETPLLTVIQGGRISFVHYGAQKPSSRSFTLAIRITSHFTNLCGNGGATPRTLRPGGAINAIDRPSCLLIECAETRASA